MTQIRHASYAGPPPCERCGKKHPQPWAHAGEIICRGCNEAHAPGSYRSQYCKTCEAKL